jgi:hypothetical protein
VIIEGNRYYLRRPRITSITPETNARALLADAGLISGAATAVPKAALPIPINSNMYPNSLK